MLTVTGERLMVEAVSDKCMKVGVFGAYGFGNMGDALLAEATIAGLKRYLPNAEFIGICQQPENAKRRHDIEALPIYRDYIRTTEKSDDSQVDNKSHSGEEFTPSNDTSLFHKVAAALKTIPPLFKFLKFSRDMLKLCLTIVKEVRFSLFVYWRMRKIDLLVMSGSGLMNEEWGGPWSLPFALFRWSLLARLAGCKVAFMSVGGGSFKIPITRFFCKWAVNLAHYKSLRDENTYNHLASWGADNLLLVPDLAFSAELPSAPARKPDAPLTLCINPISYCDPRSWHQPDAEQYDIYTSKLAEFGSNLLEKGYALHFVPNNIEMDNPTIDDILAKIDINESNKHLILRTKAETYQDVYKGIGECDLIIASRFHGVVFSLMQSKPVIGVAHHYKYNEVLKEMEQGEYCLDIQSFSSSDLLSLFNKLEIHKEEISHTIAKHAEEYRLIVEQQFHTVASLTTVK